MRVSGKERDESESERLRFSRRRRETQLCKIIKRKANLYSKDKAN